MRNFVELITKAAHEKVFCCYLLAFQTSYIGIAVSIRNVCISKRMTKANNMCAKQEIKTKRTAEK